MLRQFSFVILLMVLAFTVVAQEQPLGGTTPFRYEFSGLLRIDPPDGDHDDQANITTGPQNCAVYASLYWWCTYNSQPDLDDELALGRVNNDDCHLEAWEHDIRDNPFYSVENTFYGINLTGQPYYRVDHYYYLQNSDMFFDYISYHIEATGYWNEDPND
jgi:hypothetical protein